MEQRNSNRGRNGKLWENRKKESDKLPLIGSRAGLIGHSGSGVYSPSVQRVRQTFFLHQKLAYLAYGGIQLHNSRYTHVPSTNQTSRLLCPAIQDYAVAASTYFTSNKRRVGGPFVPGLLCSSTLMFSLSTQGINVIVAASSSRIVSFLHPT